MRPAAQGGAARLGPGTHFGAHRRTSLAGPRGPGAAGDLASHRPAGPPVAARAGSPDGFPLIAPPARPDAGRSSRGKRGLLRHVWLGPAPARPRRDILALIAGRGCPPVGGSRVRRRVGVTLYVGRPVGARRPYFGSCSKRTSWREPRGRARLGPASDFAAHRAASLARPRRRRDGELLLLHYICLGALPRPPTRHFPASRSTRPAGVCRGRVARGRGGPQRSDVRGRICQASPCGALRAWCAALGRATRAGGLPQGGGGGPKGAVAAAVSTITGARREANRSAGVDFPANRLEQSSLMREGRQTHVRGRLLLQKRGSGAVCGG
jgi:hypothetical protein